MGLVVVADRPLSDVTDQGVARHLPLAQLKACAFKLQALERSLANVRDKVGLPNVLQTQRVSFLSDRKEILLADVAVRKGVGAVEDKVGVSVDIEDHRRIGDSQKLYGLPPAVDDAMPCVQR